MAEFIAILNEADVGQLLLLIGLLWAVGSKMSSFNLALKTWSWRIAAGVFIAHTWFTGYVLRPTEADDWVALVWRSLLVAALGLGAVQIGLSALAFLLQPVIAVIRSHVAAIQMSRSNLRYQAEQQRRQEELRRQEAERRSREISDSIEKAMAVRRCEDARLRCILVYDRYSGVIAERLPREVLEGYLARFIPDTLPAQIADERASSLMAQFVDWGEKATEPARKRDFTSMEQLATFFQKQRDEIASLPYDEDTKDSLITAINIQEAQAIQRFFTS